MMRMMISLTSTSQPMISVSLMMMMATATVTRKIKAVVRKKKTSLKNTVLSSGWTVRLSWSEWQEGPLQCKR